MNEIKSEFLVAVSEAQMYDYISSLSPQMVNIPDEVLTGKLYDFNGKNPERDLDIILQKIELSLFYSASIISINTGTDEKPIITAIGDATNLFNINELGSDFSYFISNNSNNISNNVLADKAKNALSFLNDDPFVINWDIVFNTQGLDGTFFSLTIQTSQNNYKFLLDIQEKKLTM